MAQGTVKTKPKVVAKTNTGKIRKGARTFAPKKQALITQKRLIKKHSSQLISMTEKNLAEKAGHLEMLKGGRKKGEAAENQKAKGKSTATKGK